MGRGRRYRRAEMVCKNARNRRHEVAEKKLRREVREPQTGNKQRLGAKRRMAGIESDAAVVEK